MMRVIESKVLVRVRKSSTCTQKAGNVVLEIPNGTGEYEIGEVLSVGEKICEEVLKPGNIVYIYPGCGKAITVGGESLRVISVSEVISVED